MSHRHAARQRRGTSRVMRGKRRLTPAIPLPALVVLGVIPATSQGSAGQHVPSDVLCSGWASCASHGYSSHRYGIFGGASYWRMSAGDECTNYVAYVESRIFHAPTPGYLLGNGGQWAATAAAHGVVVNPIPSVGAVAEWNGGAFGMGSLGHVAVVEKVGPHDSYIYISQQHISSDVDGYDWTRINAGFPADEWQEWPDNFIHFPIAGRAAVGYFDSRRGSVELRYSLSSGPPDTRFQLSSRPGMIAVVGNWTGHSPGIGYYDPRTGWFHLRNALRYGRSGVAFRFGPPGMIPLAGNWTGHGGDKIGYYDSRTGTFYLRDELSSGPASYVFAFGPPGMVPLAGDWTGSGREGIGYYDPRTGTFYLRDELSAGRASFVFRFGPPGMVPVVGNWAGGRSASIGYYDRRTGWFYLRSRLTHGRPDCAFRFGGRGMTPLAGDWLG